MGYCFGGCWFMMWNSSSSFAILVTMKFCFTLILWTTALLSTTVSARDLQVRLDLKPGEPRNGAFCTDDEKHLILNKLEIELSQQRNTNPETFQPDQPQWCESLCMPHRINFCKMIKSKCNGEIDRDEETDRRRLMDTNTEDVIDEDLLEDLFDLEDEEPTNHVRRLLGTTELTTEEAKACKAEKKILMKKFSRNLQGQVQKSCMKMMRQKLRLTCVMF